MATIKTMTLRKIPNDDGETRPLFRPRSEFSHNDVADMLITQCIPVGAEFKSQINYRDDGMFRVERRGAELILIEIDKIGRPTGRVLYAQEKSAAPILRSR